MLSTQLSGFRDIKVLNFGKNTFCVTFPKYDIMCQIYIVNITSTVNHSQLIPPQQQHSSEILVLR